MRLYIGSRIAFGAIVAWRDSATPGGQILPPRHDVRSHSPDGFAWGYGGSGPAQLALALCLHVLNDDTPRALRVYQEVKVRLLVPLTEDRWQLTEQMLLDTIAAIEHDTAPEILTRYGKL